jgi:NitT/TauT family transport system permease protein
MIAMARDQPKVTAVLAQPRAPAEATWPSIAFSPLLSRFWPPALAAALLIAAWEFAVWWFRLPNFVLPTPQEIVSAALEDPQQLMHDTVATVTEAIGGYVAGSALGLAIAIAFVMLPIAGRLLMPLYVIVNSVPMIAYGPLAIILLGTGAASKVVLIIIAVSYTVLVNALAGLRDCDPGIVAMLRSFGASDRAILLKLRIPGAVPTIFSGLRVAVVHAMILAVVLEMLGASVGLGWSVYKSTQMMSFVEAWVAVSASVIVSLAVYGLVSFIGRRCIWW